MSKRYNSADINEILELYSSGMSIEQVAKVVSPSRTFVAKVVKDFGYSRSTLDSLSLRHSGTIGAKYGKLTAVEILGIREYGKDNRMFFLFSCDCGNTIELPIKQVSSMKTRSCGCLKYEDRERQTAKYVFKSIKHGAKSRNLDFMIEFDDFLRVAKSPCAYCGDVDTKNKWSYVGESSSSSFLESVNNRNLYDLRINGLDRVNSSLGYTVNNVVSCCASCNRAKMDLSLDEFLLKIKKIYKWLKMEE
jgi:hypothetical protein